MSVRFALIGAAGFVAPRHMQAIRGTDCELVAAYDPSDSVGILDSYFPDARFFTEFERFDRHVDKLGRIGEGVSYLSVCSPNYLHDAHVRYGLRLGADVICEKPLVLNPWNLDGLREMERATNRRISTILQLRLHPAVIALREKVSAAPKHKIFDVDLSYITARGNWYYTSWKGDQSKSGGIATNIGVHFFDMLIHVFGAVKRNAVHLHEASRAAGYLELERARVRWYMSIDRSDLPAGLNPSQAAWRSLTIDREEFEFSGGFTDLHTESYKAILAGRGFGIEEVRPSIETVSALRDAVPDHSAGSVHPMAASYVEKDA